MHPRFCLPAFLLVFAVGCGGPGNDRPAVVVDPARVNKPDSEDPTKTGPFDPRTKSVDPNEVVRSVSEKLIDTVLTNNVGLTNADRYEAAVRDAWRLLAEGREEEALAKLKEARTFEDTAYVQGEIERVENSVAQRRVASSASDAAQKVVDSGNAQKASELAVEALKQFEGGDDANRLADVKRQADALLSQQLDEKTRKQRFIDEATVARKDGNLRLAMLASERALANGVDDADFRKQAEEVQQLVQKYDDSRTRAQEMRRDPAKLEEVITVLKVGQQAWDTTQIRQDIADAEAALQYRRDRVAVADFEVIGDVGVPLLGRTISEEILPRFRERFDLVERSQLNSLLKELSLEAVDLSSGDRGRKEIAQLAKARFLVVGSVTRLNGLVVNARLVDVGSGVIVQTARISVATPADLSRRLIDLARMLQMNDAQKIAYENELLQQTQVIAAAPQVVSVPEAPAVVAESTVTIPAVPPIVTFATAPPPGGPVAFQSFQALQPLPPEPVQVVISEAQPVVRDRALNVSIELGDNLFRRGRYSDAQRHFQFALTLAPGNQDIRLRLDRCRPFIVQPAPVVVFVPPPPRLAVLNFSEIGSPFIVPPGLGAVAADLISPYFQGRFQVVDRNEVFWWMARLGLSIPDVLNNPQARLCLARAMNVRFFLLGSLRATASFDVNVYLVDPEFNATTGHGHIHVQNPHEMKLRLGELVQQVFRTPEQKVVDNRRYIEVQDFLDNGRNLVTQNDYVGGLNNFERVLAIDPGNQQALWLIQHTRHRQREWQSQEGRRLAFIQQQQQIHRAQEQQLALAAAAENARIQAIQQQQLLAEVERQRIQREQDLAYQSLLIQGRTSLKQNNFSISINFFQSALNMRRNDAVVQELAQARASHAAFLQQQENQQRLAQQAAIQAQQERELAAARLRIAEEATRRQREESERQAALANQNKAEYNRLLNQAQLAQAKGNFDLAINALQAARGLQPTPEVEKLISANLVEQARESANRKGKAEKEALEKQLALEKQRRIQAEAEAEKNRVLYETAMSDGRKAMKERRFDAAVASFRSASLRNRTDESIRSMQQAQDEIARLKTDNDRLEKEKATAAAKDLEFTRLLTEGRAAIAAQKFDQGLKLLRDANAIKPGIETQTELVKAEQARTVFLNDQRKKKEELERTANFRKQFDAGKAALLAKQYDAAVLSLREATKLDPSNAEAKLALAQAEAAQLKMGRDAAEIAAQKQKQDQFQSLKTQARAAMNLKRWDVAATNLNQAKALFPMDVSISEMLAEVEKEKKVVADSEAMTAKKLQLAKDLEGVRNLIRTEKFDAASQMLGFASKSFPNDPEVRKVQTEMDTAKKLIADRDTMKEKRFQAMLAQAKDAIRLQKPDQAAGDLDEAAKIRPTDPAIAPLRTQIADLRKKLDADSTAMKDREAAYQKAMQAGQAAMTTGKFADAEKSFTEALRLKPNDAKATADLNNARQKVAAMGAEEAEARKKQTAFANLIQAGQTSLTSGKFDDAIAKFTEAQKLFPMDTTARNLLVKAQQAKTTAMTNDVDAKKKQAAFLEAMKLGRAALDAKKYEEAIAKFTEAQKLNPTDPDPAFMLQIAQKKKNDFTLEMDENKKKQVATAVAAGEAALLKQNWDEAIRQANVALNLLPTDSAAKALLTKAQQGKATAMANEGELKKKQLAYQTAMNAAQAAAQKQDWTEAVRQYGEALKAMPGDPAAINAQRTAEANRVNAATQAMAAEKKKNFDALMQQGQLAMQQKRYPAAIDSFTQALKLFPNDPTATKGIADAKVAMTPPPIPPNPNKAAYESAMTAGRALMGAKKYEEATAKFTEALRLMPNDPDATKLLNDARNLVPKVNPNPNPIPKVNPNPNPNPNPNKAAYDGAMANGRALLGAKNYGEAIRNFTEALRLMPNDPEATRLLNEARNLQPKVNPNPNPNPNPIPKVNPNPNPIPNPNKAAYDGAMANGRALLGAKNYGEAIRNFTEALRLMPNDPEATRLLNEARNLQPKPKGKN